MTLSERLGCSFFSSTARANKSACLFRGFPRSERPRRYNPGTPSSFKRRHWRRKVRTEMRRRCPLGSRRSSWLSAWKYRSRCASGISPRSTGLKSEHQKTAQSSSLRPIVFDSVPGTGTCVGVPRYLSQSPILWRNGGRTFPGRVRPTRRSDGAVDAIGEGTVHVAGCGTCAALRPPRNDGR
jgi:hypothetical protein